MTIKMCDLQVAKMIEGEGKFDTCVLEVASKFWISINIVVCFTVLLNTAG